MGGIGGGPTSWGRGVQVAGHGVGVRGARTDGLLWEGAGVERRGVCCRGGGDGNRKQCGCTEAMQAVRPPKIHAYRNPSLKRRRPNSPGGLSSARSAPFRGFEFHRGLAAGRIRPGPVLAASRRDQNEQQQDRNAGHAGYAFISHTLQWGLTVPRRSAWPSWTRSRHPARTAFPPGVWYARTSVRFLSAVRSRPRPRRCAW